TSTNISVTVSDYKDADKLMGVEKSFNETLNRSNAKPAPKGTGYNTIENASDDEESANSVVLNVPLAEGGDRGAIDLVEEDKVTVTDVDGVSRTVKGVKVDGDVLQVTLSAEDADGETLPEYVDAKIPYTVTVEEGALSVETDKVKLDNVPKDKDGKAYEADDFTNKLVND